MPMEMHLASMRLQRIANHQTIPVHSVLHRKHSCGSRSTVMIPCIKVITSICNGTAHPYNEQQIPRQLLKQDIKIKTVLFIYSKHLQNWMLFGKTTCCVNVYMKCCCLSAIP